MTNHDMPPKEPLTTLLSKRPYLLLTGGTVFLVGIIAVSVFAYHRQSNMPVECTQANCVTTVPTKKPSPLATVTPQPTAPATLPSLLDGSMVPAGQENIHPLAVMIENHPDARPQSGLSQASLVYEAIAEGGITRFMAVFRDPQVPVKVGPIRSARTYFLHYANEIDAFYAHVGGNMDALDEIPQDKTLNLDQFAIGSPVYHREFTRPVALEHTMYSSTDKLWDYATNTQHYSRTTTLQPWLFQDDADVSKRPAAQVANISVSDGNYAVRWDYDPATNSYARTMAGIPHTDSNTNKQITAKNIVIETVDRQPVVTRINEHGWNYTTLGTGKALVIQNGVKINGTWKHDLGNRTRYYDAAGKEISFVRGSTWVEIAHSDSAISVTP
jgi:hypothetical protein